MADDGVLVATDGSGTWAWVAVRIDAAADLIETREYAGLPEPERLRKAAVAETAWLAGQLDTAADTRVELRYLVDPSAGRLSCAVLGRVYGTDERAVVPEALRLRERLAGLPRHVHATAITATAEVGRWLAPFRPSLAGMADIRRRIRFALPNRPDAGVAHYLAVEPFTVAAPSWEPLWQALAAHPDPAMLTVGVAPYPGSGSVAAQLDMLATQYGRLAAPGTLPGGGLWSSGVELAPDAFAVDAARLFADAARRYRSQAFRLRVTLASPEPLPPSLTELVAATISPPQRPTGASALTSTFQGAPHVVVRPLPHEFATAWHNVSTLDHLRWDAQYLRDLPVRPPPVVRLAAELADPREAASAMRLPLAVHGHMPGFPVRRPGMALEAEYQPSGPHVVLGRQLVADRAAGPLGIELSDLTRHALFTGTTGSGKTNSTLAFCEQLWRDHRIPFLVLEPTSTTLDDYRWLATRPGMEDLVVFTVGDENTAPFRLNPFAVPPGVRIGTHIAGLLACFDAAFGLWDPLPAIFNRALRDTYARRGIVPTDRAGPRHEGNWPTLGDFVARMHEQTDRLDYSGEVRSTIMAASRLRAESLAEGACAGTLDCATSYPVAELLRRPVVIELAEAGDNEKEQSLLTALILQTMTEYYKAGRESGDLAHVTVVEEAHRLLGRRTVHRGTTEGNAQARAAQAFAGALAENGKYGEALVIVEQVPGKLVEDAYKNTNLKVMHRLPAEDDRAVIGSTMRLSADQERYAATLEPFTAFAYHGGMDRPALIRVPDVRAEAARAAGLERAPLATDEDLAGRFRTLRAAVPEFDAAIAPFTECEGCAHRCLFRSRAATAVRPEHAAELKTRVQDYPGTAATQARWWRETVGWTHAIADEVALDSPSEAERRDYTACVFVHVARRAWRRDVLPWVQRYRQHTGTNGADGAA
ncbi:ATP-binding protein [Actinomadura sp. 3N508]|uniref:ATP-binding protein n=1 Tax=Actinomadura sp. 3N508 TaxID=3375153 RepID=UPI0037B38ED8